MNRRSCQRDGFHQDRIVVTVPAFEELFRNLSIPAAERGLPVPGTIPFDVSAAMAEQAGLGTEVVGPPMGAGTMRP